MALLGLSTIQLILILLAAIYVYILFYNTKTAIAITLGIFTVIWKVLSGIVKFILRLFGVK